MANAKATASFILDAYPGSLALKRIDDPAAVELRSMSLHLTDLKRCREALDALSGMRETAGVPVVETLWEGIITRYFKCYGKSVTGVSLIAAVVLDKHNGAMETFMYFKRLRDSQVVPDSAAFAQAFTAVVVNDIGAESLVADITTVSYGATTANDEHLALMSQLIDVTSAWVLARQKHLQGILLKRYARYSHAQLLALPDVQLQPHKNGA
ncbi:MAG TPA: hypothetical protein VIT92_09295 [Burkholderiaceae bacterium]